MRRIKHAAAWPVPAVLLAGYAGQARAGEDEGRARTDENLVLVKTIDVQSAKGIATFDIGFVDPKRNLYVLADRTNASVDFFNAADATFITRVGGFQARSSPLALPTIAYRARTA